ncbi:biotin--[acetyl-CoA-carboxylase] ligase [Sulfurimonas paralvinellae]|uniref:Biotin--[acetyl-CoA-carboxylase] ligase n=1 Tax=Sulfurimonas paralvinellae TaxID=317658 RepID=A0A7M1B746_9BACT|nr:biotin--[acetyl-CoA-carboxylase] ligase [Sulfurimonas paralvinellae]
MQIICLDRIDSTQTYLKEQLQNKKFHAPIAVSAELQTNGIGSRDNSWKSQKGNLFLSFALPLENLPDDLKIESASIYFAFLLKEALASFSSKVWIKWPNDFYLDDKKVGGMITNIVDKNLVCGVGLNIADAPDGFTKLDVEIDKKVLIKNYFKNIEKKVLWKQVFSKYKLEFYRNQNFFTHSNGVKVSLGDAELYDDGSLNINGERIYSLR